MVNETYLAVCLVLRLRYISVLLSSLSETVILNEEGAGAFLLARLYLEEVISPSSSESLLCISPLASSVALKTEENIRF